MTFRQRLRRKRVWVPVLTVVGLLALLVILSLMELLIMVGGRGTSMAPTIPACSGRGLAEGFTYKFRDPRRGEIVVFHASGEFGGDFVPDPSASQSLEKRLIGVPGDIIVGRGRRVFVNGEKVDDIETPPFPRVRLEPDEYFVLGDNRTFSQDSRDFGPVPRDAIFARSFLLVWPLGSAGVPDYDKQAVPRGDIPC